MHCVYKYFSSLVMEDHHCAKVKCPTIDQGTSTSNTNNLDDDFEIVDLPEIYPVVSFSEIKKAYECVKGVDKNCLMYQYANQDYKVRDFRDLSEKTRYYKSGNIYNLIKTMTIRIL